MPNDTRFIHLDRAVREIGSLCSDAPNSYVVIAGAGLSSPEIPTAGEIVQHCKQKCAGEQSREPEPFTSNSEEYSYWFQAAFPHPGQRQKYLKGLMEDARISEATIRLAHILVTGFVSTTVITPNFDDLISRALHLFGASPLVCDHPATVERIDPGSPDIQLLHVHGTFWYYDCCNLNSEVIGRAAAHLDLARNVTAKVSQLFETKTPLVIGYSGWEEDAVMKALRLRLESRRLRDNLYWFCFRKSEAINLPSWLRDHQDVFIVVPSTPPTSVGDPIPSLNSELQDKDAKPRPSEATLPATSVLEAMISSFDLPVPPLISEPLDFFLQSLEHSLPRYNDVSDDQYSLNHVREVVKRSRDAERERSLAEQRARNLESLRNLLRKSDFDYAYTFATELNIGGWSNDEVLEHCRLTLRAIENIVRSNARTADTLQGILEFLFSLDTLDEKTGNLITKASLLRVMRFLHDSDWSSAEAILERAFKALDSGTHLSLSQLKGAVCGQLAAVQAGQDRYEDALLTYDKALEHLREATTERDAPMLSRVLVRKATVETRLKNYVKAFESYEEVTVLYKSNASEEMQRLASLSMVGIANLKSKEGDVDEAKKWLTAAIAATDDSKTKDLLDINHEARLSLAKISDTANDEEFARAIDLCRSVRQRFHPSSQTSFGDHEIQSIIVEASILTSRSLYQDALEALNLISGYGPLETKYHKAMQVSALVSKGDIFCKQKLYHAASEAFLAADHLLTEINPEDENIRTMRILRAAMLGELGMIDDQIEIFSNEIGALDIEAPEPRDVAESSFNGFGLALLYRAKRKRQSSHDGDISDDLQLASRYFRSSLCLLSDSAAPLGNLAYCAILEGRHQDASTLIAEMLQRFGIEAYTDALQGFSRFPIPEDDVFKALVRNIWSSMRP